MSRPERFAPLFAGIAALFLLLALSACTDVATPTPIPTPTATPAVTPTPQPVYDVEAARAELAAARALWRVGGSTDYELESLASCLCPENDRPLKITVKGAVIESVVDLESGKALTKEEYVDTYTYKTIRGRFDQIGRALSDPRPAYYLSVEYHPDLGYPTSMGISFQYGVADGGFGLERLVYKPLDPSPPPATSTLSLDMEGRRAGVLDLSSGGDAMFSIGPAATVEEVSNAACDWRALRRCTWRSERRRRSPIGSNCRGIRVPLHPC